MNYEIQLKFLRDSLKKMNIQSSIVDPTVRIDESIDLGLRGYLLGEENGYDCLKKMLMDAKPNTIHRYTDSFFCKYIYLLLPDMTPDLFLVIGPFTTSEITKKTLLEAGEKNNYSPWVVNQLELYYSSIPTLPEFNHVIILIDTLAESIWGKNNYTLADSAEAVSGIEPLVQDKSNQLAPGLDMKVMEARYAFENELMDAVTHGQVHKTEMLFSNYSDLNFDQRISDQLRNFKNYSIICNTLLRKAAEKGGVHPIHLDSISSSFARKIELINNLKGVQELMKEMFVSYCKLVRKHSIRQYSPPVQKAITTINADLTADLSLSSLADAQNLSAGYLSAVFKKETGQTVTDYVNQKRMQHAAELLQNTTLQVQTVAQHCGFLDVHYFSKVFKRYIGKTPKEFKQEAHTKQY